MADSKRIEDGGPALDWTGFKGIQINREWLPDDQDLIYTALNVYDGEGDMDDDAREQIIERLLQAWRDAEMAASTYNAHRMELIEKLQSVAPVHQQVTVNEVIDFLYKHGDLTYASASIAVRLLSGNGFSFVRASLTTKEGV